MSGWSNLGKWRMPKWGSDSGDYEKWSGIIGKVKSGAYKKEDALAQTNAPSVDPAFAVPNAISWEADLHPNGPEPSSHVKRIDYFADAEQTMRVEFRDGAVVEYKDIPYSMAQDFVNSPSKGRFVNQHLKSLPYKLIK